MALVNRVQDVEIFVGWEPAASVTAPELAATWCRLELRVQGRAVTAVEDARTNSMRRGIYTSAYPLAEWIAENWWLLAAHMRPSNVPTSRWGWRNVRSQPWLRHHNFRGAGGGLPWPDLTVVPEGGLTRLLWTAGPGLADQPLTFLTSGEAMVGSADVLRALERFVGEVIARLEDVGVTSTPLQREWSMLAACDAEEAAFANAVARLGVDPFSVEDELEDDIVALAEALDEALLLELLDSAVPGSLREAALWLTSAGDQARTVGRPLPFDVASARGHVDPVSPWHTGYRLARSYRENLGLDDKDVLRLDSLVGVALLDQPSGGVRGLVVNRDDQEVGLVLPEQLHLGPASTRFAQARALGLSALTSRERLLLDPVHNDLGKVSRAFAAELLAPAAGIRSYLEALPEASSSAFEAIAGRFEASPLVIQLQYQNQIAI